MARTASSPGARFNEAPALLRARGTGPVPRLLPVAAALEFVGGPAGLWSEDRRHCVFNQAAAALLGYGDHDFCADAALWLTRIDPGDRERFAAFCEAVRANSGPSDCHYRFLPAGAAGFIELHESARRIKPPEGAPVVLSRYRGSEAAGDCRRSAHKIGNHLQTVRGEVDLLRLSGALPERSAETICRSIEAVHELVQQIGKRFS